MIRGSRSSKARLRTARPILALLALALTGLGYGTPWVLAALHDAPEVPRIRSGSSVEPERVVRIHLPPTPAPVAEPEPEPALAKTVPVRRDRAPTSDRALSVASTTDSDPLVQLGPAPDTVPRVHPGPARELRLALERDGIQRKQRANNGRKKTKRKRKRRPCEADLAEIAQVATQGYRVEDSLVAFYAGNPRETEKLASTWWNKDDAGERDGFKVGRIRCGTVLHQLGLRSGDTVMAINGKRIQSYTDGVGAYLKVRQKQLIWVDVVRKGEPLRIDYLLVADGTAEAELAEQALDPTALVEQELALAELPWLKRRKGKRAQKRRMKDARASEEDLGLPGLGDLKDELGAIPED